MDIRTYYVIQMEPPKGPWRDAQGATYDTERQGLARLEEIRGRFPGEIGLRLVQRVDSVIVTT